jgi:stage IV sporulation protein B
VIFLHRAFNKYLLSGSAVLILTFFALYIGAFILTPSSIVVRNNESSTLSLSLPLKGKLVCTDMSVAAVNDKPVTTNISIDMAKPNSFLTKNSGTAQLQLSFMGIPLKNSTVTVLPDTELIPCGQAVGMELQTDGILVLGTGEVRTSDGKYVSPCKGILKSGDLIKKADDTVLSDKESLIEHIEQSKGDVKLTIERNGKSSVICVTPVKSSDSDKLKLGIWVRDSTKGIGTITCYDKSGNFYALGHPVTDVDTGDIMKIRSGKIMSAQILSVNKGKKGSPGELIGDTNSNKITGNIITNTPCGISGKLNDNFNKLNKSYPISLKNEVTEGNASVLVTTDGNKAETYDIRIENAHTLNSDASKAMIIRITDKKLIDKTGGIVQGMSGAPIIQNGRLVGAVTHVFIQDPTKGYGIYIEDMIK